MMRATTILALIAGCCAAAPPQSLRHAAKPSMDDTTLRLLKKASDERKRLEDLNNSKLNKSKEGSADRAKKQKARMDAKFRATEQKRQELEDLGKRMDEAEMRVQNQIERRANEIKERSNEKQERADNALRRKHEWEDDLHKLALDRVAHRATKEHGLDERMRGKQHDQLQKASESRTLFLKKMMKVQEKTSAQDSDREAAFLASMEHKNKVRTQHADNLRERSREMGKKLEKGRLMSQKNLESERPGVGGALPERRAEILQKSIDKIEQKRICRDEYMFATAQRRQLNQQIAGDMVKQNQERLRRAHNYSSAQTLARIQSNNSRVDNLLDMRRQVLHARINAQRDHMIERHRIEQAFEMVKDSNSPSKVNALLKAMNIPIEGAGQTEETAKEK